MCRSRMDALHSHGRPVDVAALLRENERLRAEHDRVATKAAALAGEMERVERERDSARTELATVRHQLAKLLRAKYGRKAESVDVGLFAHLIAEESQASSAISEQEEKELRTWVKGHRRERKSRGSRYEHLPEEVREIDLAGEQRRCRCCGEDRMRIGEERHTEIEIVPAQAKRVTTVQAKYACPFCPEAGVETAAAPPRAVPRCLAGPGLLSTVVVNKYCHHLPLYRQEAVFAPMGLALSRSTMCDWARLVADALIPLWNTLRKEVRSMEPPREWRVVQTDDTPIRVLRPGSGRTKEARLWVYLGHGSEIEHDRQYAVFEYTASREGQWPRKWFAEYGGNVQADAYGGYDAMFREERITEFGCWAHARRKFYEARDLDREACLRVLGMIRELYAVEHAARTKATEREKESGERLSRVARCTLRRDMRREDAVPILDRIKAYLDELANGRRHLPKSAVGLAIEYARRNWEALRRYVDNGAVEIDNNASERMIRPVAISRKNWMFAGNDRGGETAAILFSVLGSARLHEIEPWAYMRSVLELMPLARSDDDVRQLLPDRWKAANPGHHLPLSRGRTRW